MNFIKPCAAACLAAVLAFPMASVAKEKQHTKSDGIVDAGPSELDLLLAERKAAGQPDTPELRNALREVMINRDLLVSAARKANLDKSPAMQTRLRMAEKEILARQYEAAYAAQHAPTEAQLKTAYETVKQRAGNVEYHVRQIFVAKEDEAKALVARLGKGEPFADLARSQSQDTSTRANGGDLGWLTPLTLQSFVAGTVSRLKKGEYTTTPVKGANGWHVILVEDTRPFTLASFDKVEAELRRNLTRQILVAHLIELRKQAQEK